MSSDQACPCGKKKPFLNCCGRFLEADQHAKTPEQLMRSRYSAYAIGGYGDYLLKTWFPITAKGLTAAQLSEKNTAWKKLEVISHTQQGNSGVVEFKAWFVGADGTLEAMHEVSEFSRIEGRWFYVGGRVS